MVGSVIVYKDRVIGEGWHVRAGEAHAEVRAIASVKDKQLLSESTLYVSLEPCSHYGKTPPCADLIIAHRIPRVVIGTTDPFAKVAGRGIEKLRAAGCEVTVGVMEKECRELNKRFFTFHERKRPYIFLKWAETADGFIAPALRDTLAPVWITDAYTRQEVHKMRSEEQAILVGVGTVLADNPSLDTRDWYGKNPLRVIIDPHLRSPKEFKVWNDQQPTLFITNKEKVSDKSYGLQTEVIGINLSRNVPQQICDLLYQRNIQSLIVEGGAYTLQQFINAGLYDEMRIYKSEVNFGEGVRAPQIS